MKRLMIFIFSFTVFIMTSCIEKFTIPSSISSVRLLVIDGFLDIGQKTCSVTLSRSQSIDQPNQFVPELSARVLLESESGDSYEIIELGNGKYFKQVSLVSENLRYRIKIVSSDNKIYQSDYVFPQVTPPIDNLIWRQDDQSLKINLFAKGELKSSQYFEWTYEETWQYESAYFSLYDYNYQTKTVDKRKDDVFTCWKSKYSSEILTLSTSDLSQNVVADYTLVTIPKSSSKILKKYSILAKQKSITKDRYDYLEQLKRNSENLGTPFDPLPSQVTGNFRCVSNQDEYVIGWFFSSSIQEKRLFVDQFELPISLRAFANYDSCKTFILFNEQVPFYKGNDLIIGIYGQGDVDLGYVIGKNTCVDCRLSGGTIVRPSFWQ
jgi:Domain of unknown function (DUF4249)